MSFIDGWLRLIVRTFYSHGRRTTGCGKEGDSPGFPGPGLHSQDVDIGKPLMSSSGG